MTDLHQFLVIAVIVSAIAAWADLRTGHIPNWVTLVPLGLAPAAHFLLALSSEPALSAGMSIAGAAVCALVPVALFRVHAMGGGDVKILAAMGALCGIEIGIETEFVAFTVAALAAMARLAWDGGLLRTLKNTVVLVLNPFLRPGRRRALPLEAMTPLRFGPAVFVAASLEALIRWRTS